MRKKKDLPLVILKSLEKFVTLKGDKFEVVDPKDKLLKVVDKDTDSSFHFTIEQYEKTTNGAFKLLMTRIPRSVNDQGMYQTWIETTGLTAQFDVWLNLLEQYETVNSFFDDPITKTFSEEFYAEFEIIDEEAETKPLNTKQILLLDSYLENVDNKLTEFVTEKNSDEIKEIKAEIDTLREHLTTKSRKWVVKKLTSIWGKIAKQGTAFIKEFLSESKKEIIKQGVKGLIEFVIETGHDILPK